MKKLITLFTLSLSFFSFSQNELMTLKENGNSIEEIIPEN